MNCNVIIISHVSLTSVSFFLVITLGDLDKSYRRQMKRRDDDKFTEKETIRHVFQEKILILFECFNLWLGWP